MISFHKSIEDIRF
jgi:hypothetical protein